MTNERDEQLKSFFIWVVGSIVAIILMLWLTDVAAKATLYALGFRWTCEPLSMGGEVCHYKQTVVSQ